MLRIHTVGACEIALGSLRIGTDQPLAFLLILFVAMRANAVCPRRELAELLWPDAASADRNHRLRSLLHRLRRKGAPLECTTSTIALRDFALDFREFITPPTLDLVRSRVRDIGPVLPGLVPPSAATADYLDDARDVITATVSRWLHTALDLTRAAGEWRLVKEAARAACHLDPESHGPWIALAESQCLTGERSQAVETLDALANRRDVDPAALRMAAVLRRRIRQETLTEDSAHSSVLVGREDVMRRLWLAISRARDGHGSALLLWGPAGIGKTRLIRELEGARAVGARVVRLCVDPEHALDPRALIVELVRRLLAEPGAAGCDPLSYARLCDFVSQGAINHEVIASTRPVNGDALIPSVVELLAAISDEGPLVLAIDDLHLAHQRSWHFLRAVIRSSPNPRLLWVFCYRALREPELERLHGADIGQRIFIGPLDRAAALELLASLQRSRQRSADEALYDRAGGNPMLLEVLARGEGALPREIELLVDDALGRLPPRMHQLLRSIAALGSDATPRALAELTESSRADIGAALGELERAGIIREEGGVLRAHTLWSDAVLAMLAPSERLALSLDLRAGSVSSKY
jgi:AAA ATPase domain